MPSRSALGPQEKAQLDEAIRWYQDRNQDPGYQGHFETAYCDRFTSFMGGGYADAVATGTAALFVALSALDLPKGSDVLVSPITDPGTLSAIVMLGLRPKLLDATPKHFNVSINEIQSRCDQNTSCALLVHAAGQAIAMPEIVQYCHERGIKILEDCSQAHGAHYHGQLVGTFGDIAAFSTMYRKASITGPTGGIVYTQQADYYHQALAHADRGKPRWRDDFDDRNPAQFLFPALNLHANELGCAIGIASLGRLRQTIDRRLQFVKAVSEQLEQYSQVCRPYGYCEGDSPFYYPIFVDKAKIQCNKITFAKAVRAEGIDLNPHYHYLVEEWPWLTPYLADSFRCDNARQARDHCFCLYLNEHYGAQEVDDTVAAILKVERYFLKE